MNRAMNIGQRVQNAYGEAGMIIDRMYSEAEKDYYYSVKLDNRGEDDNGELYTADEIRIVEDKTEYSVETEILSNVCVAKVFKKKDGKMQEVSRGHGHIIHEGDLGILQALSYAFKKAYEAIGGDYKGGHNNGRI